MSTYNKYNIKQEDDKKVKKDNGNIIVSIEGNIGSGKSTIINFLKSIQGDKILFVDEPVNEWKNIFVDGKNALDHFYSDISKNSFWFQILAYITRLKLLLETIENNPGKIIICERSIYTDKHVFAQMLYEKGFFSEIEWKTYLYWFDTFKNKTKLDYVLYVNTNPEECMNRINKRNREEEIGKIDIDYLKLCHEKHVDWLKENKNIKVIEINGHQSISNIQLFVKTITETEFL